MENLSNKEYLRGKYESNNQNIGAIIADNIGL